MRDGGPARGRVRWLLAMTAVASSASGCGDDGSEAIWQTIAAIPVQEDLVVRDAATDARGRILLSLEHGNTATGRVVSVEGGGLVDAGVDRPATLGVGRLDGSLVAMAMSDDQVLVRTLVATPDGWRAAGADLLQSRIPRTLVVDDIERRFALAVDFGGDGALRGSLYRSDVTWVPIWSAPLRSSRAVDVALSREGAPIVAWAGADDCIRLADAEGSETPLTLACGTRAVGLDLAVDTEGRWHLAVEETTEIVPGLDARDVFWVRWDPETAAWDLRDAASSGSAVPSAHDPALGVGGGGEVALGFVDGAAPERDLGTLRVDVWSAKAPSRRAALLPPPGTSRGLPRGMGPHVASGGDGPMTFAWIDRPGSGGDATLWVAELRP